MEIDYDVKMSKIDGDDATNDHDSILDDVEDSNEDDLQYIYEGKVDDNDEDDSDEDHLHYIYEDKMEASNEDDPSYVYEEEYSDEDGDSYVYEDDKYADEILTGEFKTA